MFSRVLYGSQVSLTIGLIGVLLSLLIGSVLGVVSGYYGGGIDNLIQRMIELVRSFPAIPLWMALSAAVPPHWPPLRTYLVVTLILSLVGWTWLARQLRGQVLAIRNSDFVLASRLLGGSDSRIIFKHLIPASIGQITVVATLAMPSMILADDSSELSRPGSAPAGDELGRSVEGGTEYPVDRLVSVGFPARRWRSPGSFWHSTSWGDGLRDASDPYTV